MRPCNNLVGERCTATDPGPGAQGCRTTNLGRTGAVAPAGRAEAPRLPGSPAPGLLCEPSTVTALMLGTQHG